MAEPHPQDSKDDTQSCAICGNLIPQRASYCTHCENYQNWWRRLLAGIDIHALIALIPIATLAFVFIKEQFVKPVAELQLAALDCAGDSVELAVANVGDRGAVFAGAVLQPEDGANIPLRFESEEKIELVVKAGETRIYHMSAADESGGSLGLGLTRSAPCRFRIRAHALAFEHTSTSDQAICACPTR